MSQCKTILNILKYVPHAKYNFTIISFLKHDPDNFFHMIHSNFSHVGQKHNKTLEPFPCNEKQKLRYT